jgi:hypothetical protein
MASSVTVAQVRPANPALRFLKLVPGLLLLAGEGYAGKLLEANVGKYAKLIIGCFQRLSTCYGRF